MRIKQCISSLLAASFVLPAIPVQAGEQMVELLSNGRYQTHRLPADVDQVQLVQPLAGDCSLNRNWGYDSSQLWVKDGCGARFRILTRGAADGGADNAGQASGSGGDNTNLWIAGAAVAAIAGAAILANKHDRDKERDREQEDDRYPGYPSPGYPNPGYPSWGGGGREIRGQNGLCLDVSGGLRRGNALVVYRCSGGENQRFTLTRDGELRVGNMCLDVADGSKRNGTRIIAWDCKNQPNQKWSWDRGQIRSRYADKCLDIEGGQARPGQPVIMWPCAGTANQRWD